MAQASLIRSILESIPVPEGTEQILTAAGVEGHLVSGFASNSAGAGASSASGASLHCLGHSLRGASQVRNQLISLPPPQWSAPRALF